MFKRSVLYNEKEQNNPVPPRVSQKNKKGNSLMSGVFVLSLSAFIVKIIGLIYKIPMLKLLGSEGMGYFNSAYEIYTLFCTVATTGLPVAMSVMISASEKKNGESGQSGDDILKVAFRIFACIGVLCSAVMVAFAKPFAEYLGNENAKWCVVAIAPTVFWICLTSVFRGYFQGRRRMLPTAISQIVEAAGKLILGLIFAYISVQSGGTLVFTASSAVLGLVLGTALSAAYLYLTKKFTEPPDLISKELTHDGKKQKNIAKRLIKMAVPITLSSVIVSLTKVIDMTMILRRLQTSGESSADSFAIYGNYTTLALPLFGLAPALVSSIAMPLIPILSGADSRNDKTGEIDAVSDALRLTMVISAPISLGLALFSKPLLQLIFPSEVNAVETVSPLLSVLAFSVAMSCLITVGNAILQAYRSVKIPILSMAIGSVFKLILAYFLIGNRKIGIMGAPISTFFCDMIINGINFWFIDKKLSRPLPFGKIFVLPILSAAVAVSLSRVVYNIIVLRLGETSYATLACVALSAALYLILSFLMGTVSKKDVTAAVGK